MPYIWLPSMHGKTPKKHFHVMKNHVDWPHMPNQRTYGNCLGTTTGGHFINLLWRARQVHGPTSPSRQLLPHTKQPPLSKGSGLLSQQRSKTRRELTWRGIRSGKKKTSCPTVRRLMCCPGTSTLSWESKRRQIKAVYTHPDFRAAGPAFGQCTQTPHTPTRLHPTRIR